MILQLINIMLAIMVSEKMITQKRATEHIRKLEKKYEYQGYIELSFKEILEILR